MNDYAIGGVLEQLSKKRPVFHSEADFQFAFAWEIKSKYPKSEIRLEYKIPDLPQKTYVDIWIKNKKTTIAIELKYKSKNPKRKSKRPVIEFNSEKFYLSNQDANDSGRYDECRDIQRIENICELYDAVGYSIFLTNDPAYWKEPPQNTTNDGQDHQFRIHEGRCLHGTLDWKEGTPDGTKDGKIDPITINGNYKLSWRNYSDLESSDLESLKYRNFRYLAIRCQSGPAHGPLLYATPDFGLDTLPPASEPSGISPS